MYFSKPGDKFEIYDQSENPDILVAEVTNPHYFYGISSDKGVEELTETTKDNFFKIFGENISFSRHGQPLLQAAESIKAGAKVLVKRVVAENSALSNLSIYAKVQVKNEQKVDKLGNLVYVDAVTGKETIESNSGANSPLMVDICHIKYVADSVENAKVIDTVATLAENKLDVNGNNGVYTYPLMTISDNGRGETHKRIRITPDYNNSKHLDYMKYTLETIENNKVIETIQFTFNPNVIESGKNRSIQSVVQFFSLQLKAKLFENSLVKFVDKVATVSGNEFDYCLAEDLFFGKDRKMVNLPNIVIDNEDDSFKFSEIFGNELQHGSNGDFGNAPFGTEAYTEQLVKLYNGEFSDDIYDLDKYKLDLIVDANYPDKVKRAIEELITFREDACYLRDIGLNKKTEEDILAASREGIQNKYATTYMLSYDIIDPYTKKQIPVTVGYSLSKLMVSHFKNGRSRPTAGQLYNMVIQDAIKGTENYLPKVTPKYDQKQTLCDARANYASYFGDALVLETLYTSQEKLTQFSYLNNVLLIQEVIKDVRTKCPKNRYNFIDGQDLEIYKNDVQAILDKHASKFKTLKFEYIQDETMVANKIFYAAIKVKFRDFAQSEYFKIYALR